MKISVLGGGAWGTCLANHLAKKGHQVRLWIREKDVLESLVNDNEHPKLLGVQLSENLSFSGDMAGVVGGAELLVESVTSKGLRPVLTQIKTLHCPLIITSKGIEQKTGLLLPDLAVEVLGEEARPLIGCLSGPSHAEEVIHEIPTSVTAASFSDDLKRTISEVFTTTNFRVYPNSDIEGVAFGGALKNVIAIACGISDALGFGDNTKAGLMTRGLHEIRKLSKVKGCKPDTLNGLSGMGDLCVTCMSVHSRNYRFGRLIGEGCSLEEAREKVGMVVEGAYTAVSALELAKEHKIQMPIAEGIYRILYEGQDPRQAVEELMNREIKEENQ